MGRLNVLVVNIWKINLLFCVIIHNWSKSTNINDAKYSSIILVSHSGTSGSPYHAFVVNSYSNGVMTTYDEGAEWRIHANQPFNNNWGQSSIYGVYNMK